MLSCVKSRTQYSTVWRCQRCYLSTASNFNFVHVFVRNISLYSDSSGFLSQRARNKNHFHIKTSSCTDYTCQLLGHYSDVIMIEMAFQITSLTIVCSTVYSGADQRKHQSSVSLALWGEFTGDRWIPLTRPSNAESVSIWWRHRATVHRHYVGMLY